MIILREKDFTKAATKKFILSKFPKLKNVEIIAEPRKYGYHHVKDMTGLNSALQDFTKMAKDKNGRLAEISLNRYLNNPIEKRLTGFKAAKGKQLQLPTNEKGSKKFLKIKTSNFSLKANSIKVNRETKNAVKKLIKTAPIKDVGVFRIEPISPMLTYEAGYGLAPRREKILLYN